MFRLALFCLVVMFCLLGLRICGWVFVGYGCLVLVIVCVCFLFVLCLCFEMCEFGWLCLLLGLLGLRFGLVLASVWLC